VRATQLERGAIFEGLAKKQTYGTTGQRIYLDLDIAGIGMGQSGRARGALSGHLTIAAPSAIARAELLRLDDAKKEFVVAAHWDNQPKLIETSFTDDPAAAGPVMYYLRVQLAEPVRGRVVRAWSSPVWIDR